MADFGADLELEEFRAEAARLARQELPGLAEGQGASRQCPRAWGRATRLQGLEEGHRRQGLGDAHLAEGIRRRRALAAAGARAAAGDGQASARSIR